MNKEDVIQAFERTDEYHRRFFVPHLAPLILKILTEKKFPKTRTARIGFLSDSLGAEGAVSARRSRDICAAERHKARVPPLPGRSGGAAPHGAHLRQGRRVPAPDLGVR